ncbi:MAG: hypothetical protein IPF41_16045 [Flavobacteriales bacterium]|nr:hypothetical protein [Flavobacteriales bacterium]
MESNQTSSATPPASGDKTVAIVAYLSLVGFVIALILHNQEGKKTELGAFHLRQGLGILISSVAMSIISIIPILGWIVGCLGLILVLVMWIMGIIAAANGEMKPAPVLGAKFQEWFKTAFV